MKVIALVTGATLFCGLKDYFLPARQMATILHLLNKRKLKGNRCHLQNTTADFGIFYLTLPY